MDPFDIVRGAFGHVDPSRSRTSERNHSDARMTRNCCSHGGSVTIDQVIYARRHTGFMKDLGQHMGCERSQFRRFVHYRTAGRKRWEGFDNQHIDRPVPRSNRADHADWFTAYDCAVALRILELVVLQNRNGRLQVPKSDAYLYLLCKLLRRPKLLSQYLRQIILTRCIHAKYAGQQIKPLLPATERKTDERFSGRLDGTINIGCST